MQLIYCVGKYPFVLSSDFGQLQDAYKNMNNGRRVCLVKPSEVFDNKDRYHIKAALK